jgi:hypothetical protein
MKKIFLGGDCSDGNEWREEIKRQFSTISFVDPFDKNWIAEKNIYDELSDMLMSDYIVFYRGGEGTKREKEFVDSIGLKYYSFDDLNEMKKFIHNIDNVKPNILKVANKILTSLKFDYKTIHKDKEVFQYSEIARDLWYEKFNDACDHFKIKFDLENNESVKERKTIVVKENKDTEWEFNCELMAAGGDWECANLYFKCQFRKGLGFGYDNVKLPYPGNINTGKTSYFVLIPPINAGNTNLVKLDGEDYDYGSIQDNSGRGNDLDYKAAWDWVKKYLTDYVQKYVDAKESVKTAQYEDFIQRYHTDRLDKVTDPVDMVEDIVKEARWIKE